MPATSHKRITAIILIALGASWLPYLMPGQRLMHRVRAAVTSDVRVSSSSDPDPRDETSIAVSPVNDRIVVGVSKVIVGGAADSFRGVSRVAYYFSSDGGATWGEGLIPLQTPEKLFERATDPSVIADVDGNFYVAVLMLDNSSFDNGVYVFKSIDGGRTFFDPRPAFLHLGNPGSPVVADKCYMTVDTSSESTFRNSLYVVWMNTDYGPTGVPRAVIKICHRRVGEFAFSAPKTISHDGDMRGPSVATGPNGEVYAAWEGIGNPRVILFNASTDGGETFLPPAVTAFVDFNIHNFVGSLSPPNTPIPIDGISRMNSFPVIDVDRSNGPDRGTIYIAYAESLNGNDADVYVKRMPPPNGGIPVIGSPVRVNNDAAGAHQFFPWLSVDDSDGTINVCFYDRRESAGLNNTYLGRSSDGGRSFAENLKISSASSDPRIQSGITGINHSAIGIGDYIGLKMIRGKASLLWTDTRNGKQEVFFGRADFGGGGGGGSGAPANDICQSAHSIASLPFVDLRDVAAATSSAEDPVACAGTAGSNTVWYSMTAAVDTYYGVDTSGSDYDTVVSVFSGACDSLSQIACSDDFGHGVGSQSVLAFQARAGVHYLIEVAAKGAAGTLRLRVGYPTVTLVEYGFAPDESRALKIGGAGFVNGNTQVVVRRGGVDETLPTTFFEGPIQSDGTVRVIYGFRKKIKKILPPGEPVIVTVRSPSDRESIPFQFVR